MPKPTVILLHGIWMPGTIMGPLRHRLENRFGYECRLFDYPSLSNNLDENAERLAEHVGYVGSKSVALVGHSLGGLVSLRMLAQWHDSPVTRVVCLGSPLMGSQAASVLNRYAWGRAILGNCLPQAILTDEGSAWAEEAATLAEVGVIAGNRATGLGRLVGGFEGPNDGTVSVAETRLPGIKDHLVMPVSHTGMVFSSGVAEQTAAFLDQGEFHKIGEIR